MADKISFTIQIRGDKYNGYLDTNDTSQPPKIFFVLIDDNVIGNLMFMKQWAFKQVGERFSKFTPNELGWIAEYLGSIAVEANE